MKYDTLLQWFYTESNWQQLVFHVYFSTMLKIITNTGTSQRYLLFQESPCLLQNLKMNCHVQRSPTLIHIMSQTSSPHLSPYLLNNDFKNRNQQMCMYFLSLIHVTSPVHLIFLQMITLMVWDTKYFNSILRKVCQCKMKITRTFLEKHMYLWQCEHSE